MTFICLTSVLAIFLFWDLVFRFCYVLNRKWGLKVADHCMSSIPGTMFSLVWLFIGFRIHVEGKKNRKLPKQFLVVSNHQSIVDIPVLLYTFPETPLRFVAKKELEKWVPYVSGVLKRQKHCLVSRKGAIVKAFQALTKFGRDCNKYGFSPSIFPEGTRSRTGDVGPFQAAGVRKILDECSLPIVCVALEGGYKLSDLKSLNAKNLRGSGYKVAILSVYEAPKDKLEVQAVLAKCKSEIEEKLVSWRKDVQ